MRYLDANVFCFAALDSGPEGEHARKILTETNLGTHPAITSVLTLDEVAWTIRKEASHENALKEGSRLLGYPNLYILDVKAKHWATALDLMEKHTTLQPRDALHAAVAIDAGVFTIVSTDSDFDALPQLDRIPL